jgi:hypothetical protein
MRASRKCLIEKGTEGFGMIGRVLVHSNVMRARAHIMFSMQIILPTFPSFQIGENSFDE